MDRRTVKRESIQTRWIVLCAVRTKSCAEAVLKLREKLYFLRTVKAAKENLARFKAYQNIFQSTVRVCIRPESDRVKSEFSYIKDIIMAGFQSRYDIRVIFHVVTHF